MTEFISNIKVIKKIGNKPGKTTVILAGVHGNETCGIKAFNKIIPKLKIEFGKVIFIYANLKAIKQNKRFIEKNLNRCFFKSQPTEIKESLEGETAKEIIPYLNSTDMMLDLHASFTKDSIPFVICGEKNLKDANIFNADIVTYNWDLFESGSTDYYMNLKNKPAFCFECGYIKDKKCIETAKEAIFNFLIFSGNIKGKLFIKKNQKYIKIKYLYKNKKEQFRKFKDFKDFEKFNKKSIVGFEGDKPVFVEKEDIILFLRNSEGLNEECFLLAKETLLNQKMLIKLSKEEN